MSDYINREDAIEMVLEPLNNMPAADVVEVVRCKDCKYWWKVNEVCNEEHHIHEGCCITDVKADDYCSYGEKKDESDTADND